MFYIKNKLSIILHNEEANLLLDSLKNNRL